MMNKMRGDVTVDHDYLLCQHLGLGLAPLCNLGFIPLPVSSVRALRGGVG